MEQTVAPLGTLWSNDIFKEMVKKRYNRAFTIAPRLTDLEEEDFQEGVDEAVDLANRWLKHKNGIAVFCYLEEAPWWHTHGLLRIKTQLRRKHSTSWCLDTLSAACCSVFGSQCGFSQEVLYHPDGWQGYITKQTNSSAYMA